jgi:type IV pilus assembly protein PilV
MSTMKHKQRGIMLVEAMIAVLLLGIGLLGAIGIQARSISALSDATMRSEATMAGEALVATMTNDQANAANYAMVYNATTPPAALLSWYNQTRDRIPGAKLGVTVTTPVAGTTYRRVDIRISWQRKQGAGEFENTHTLSAHLGTGRLKDTW